jgi:hypothetical protein
VNITLPLAVTGFGEKAQVGKSTAPDGAEVNVAESVIAPAVSVTASVEVPEPPWAVIGTAVPEVLFGDVTEKDAPAVSATPADTADDV